MTENQNTYDVLVVGAGPSGLTTAITATRNGARVLLVDRHARTSIFPKATGLRPRTMELMRAWGLEERVRSGAQDVHAAVAVSTELAGPPLEVSPLLATDPAVMRRVSPTWLAIAPQDHLEPVLLDHLLGLGGEVRFGVSVTDLDQHDDLVRVQVVSGTGAETIRARHVVGADGAGSTVRRLVGLGVRPLGDEGDHLATLFRADLASHLPAERYALYYLLREDGDVVVVPSGTDGRWVVDREFHPERGETVEEWTDERSVAFIREATGIADLDVQVIGVFPWSFGAAVATGVRVDRVFLVGDAAHRTTPRGATGMNTGIADGHNLGWKLGWVARGLAGESLLASYADERYPVGLHNALASLADHTAEAAQDLGHDFGVVYASPAVQSRSALDTTETYQGAVIAAVPGARAPHAWVSYGGERLSTVDLFEGQLSLVTGPGGGVWRSAAARVGVPLLVHVVGDDVVDLDGDVVHRYRLGERAAVLVRPDGHVAWVLAGADPERELDDALATALDVRTPSLLSPQSR